MSAAPRRFPIARVMAVLAEETARWPEPIVTQYARRRAAPFLILISTLLSLRTQDKTTAAASARLFDLADTPRAMLALSRERIAEAIYPVGFYKTKAATILEVCRTLLERWDGQVPDDLDDLLTLKGVGRKTANLVMTRGFGKPGICVDTHVHRIVNRWGYVETRTPDRTEMALRKRLPRRWWIPINDWLVGYGQHLCTPTSPWCSRCRLTKWCARRNVERSR